MKNISKYLGVVLLLVSAACSKTQEGTHYNPNNDDAKEIHFIQSSIEKEFAQDSQSGVIDVQIARSGNKGSFTVYLTNKGDNADLFEVPETVAFADGEYSVTIPVKVDLRNFVRGSNYKTTLLISDREAKPGEGGAQISQFSDKVTLSASYELEWEPYMRTNSAGEQIQQLATFHYSLYYTGRDSELEVEKAIGANIFRVKDWASGVAFKFILNSDNTCTVPAQSIGYFNSNYNEYVYVADMAVYTGNDAAYNSYPCTYDGKDTFSFYLIYYVSAGYFNQGTEKLVFDSDPDTTPIVDITFQGIETTPTGFRAPRLYFSPNSYAKYYKASVVAGDITTNVYRQEQIRQQLIDGELEGDVPIRTLYSDDESVWNVPKGNYTAIALPYDADDEPGKLYTERFTCDPNNEYGIQVHEFDWFASDQYPAYSPYTTLFWQMKVGNVTSMKYYCVTAQAADYLVEAYGMSFEEIVTAYGREMPEETIEEMLSEEGRLGVFPDLAKGTSYTIGLLMTNQFGDTSFVSKTATTFGHFSSDFDQTKTLDDFLGAFLATATVTAGSSSKEVNYRMDIARVNDSEVIIKGTSDMRDFSPEISAFYDKEKHMLIVEPQSAGMYESNYVMFGLYDGMSLYWGSSSLAIGYIGDTLYWAASPYAEDNVYGYVFLLFNSPQANSSTYLRQYVGSKIYTSISMKPLIMASSQSVGWASAERKARTIALDAGTDVPIQIYLMGDETLNSPKRKAVQQPDPASTAPAEGKTLRTDLVLRTR